MLIKPLWKKIADTVDLMTSETHADGLVVRIEARKNDNDVWEIFKTYLDDTTFSFTEEYHTKTRKEAQYIVRALQHEKLLTKQEIASRRLERATRLHIRVKRQFKDYNVERWNFSIDGGEYENMLYLREAEIMDVSILMPEKHRSLEKPILAELHAILGMDHADLDIREEIYYYTTRSEKAIQSKRGPGLFLGKVEMGFDFSDDKE
jgi:hypothetical protein